MERYDVFHDILVNLFQEIMDIEEKALITAEFKNISVNDMSVTVGTLTIAINNLVKKGYVSRVRSEEDRRVVLIFLTEKGKRAYQHHREFHDGMVKALVEGLDEGQQKILVKSLLNLRTFFDSYKKD